MESRWDGQTVKLFEKNLTFDQLRIRSRREDPRVVHIMRLCSDCREVTQ